MTTIDDRVAAGASWLDANRPGWWQRINLDRLDLGDPCECVLGQEYGNYAAAPAEIWDGNLTVSGGFNAPSGDHKRAAVEFGVLTRAWRTLITARRNAEDPWAHWADEPDADPAPAAWPGRTHDGQRMRDTETADVDRGVL